ncbi:MAG TPA: ATP-binding protein [Puia sp.]|nr:ATP-binding protein [Puia sp.]
MFRTIFFLIIALLGQSMSIGQSKRLDSIRHVIESARPDTTQVLLMSSFSYELSFVNSDSSRKYANEALDLAKRIDFPRGELRALKCKADFLETNGDLPGALKLGFSMLEESQQNNFVQELSISLSLIGNVFYDLNDYAKAISFYERAVPINETLKNTPEGSFWKFWTEINLGTAFMFNKQLDSAYAHLSEGYIATKSSEHWHPVFSMFFGDLLFRIGHRDTAVKYLHTSLQLFRNAKENYSVSDGSRILARFYRDMNLTDSSIFYAKISLAAAESIGYKTTMLEASELLAELYEPNDLKLAIFYRKIYDSINAILYGPNQVKNLQKTITDEQDRERKIEEERTAYRERVREYGLIAGLFIILGVALIFYRNSVQRRNANYLLQQEKEKVEATLQHLKSTQAQLIQSEKMASLGELTAGIAHEIQNPLNFVNNFSEVNDELISDLKSDLLAGHTSEAVQLATTIQENERKIIEHGKRAEGIVKGMLQHSRTDKGERQLADINAIADECLKLSYLNQRAKDQTLEVQVTANLDPTVGKIQVIPQDIVRVLVNLFNNAFYAVTKKMKEQSNRYIPAVSVSTRQADGLVYVAIADNGIGISAKIKDKIFQPFFTTKPTGQGTGLGLSLSYDIIKAHGGNITVVSEEGKFSEFIVSLPV